ncbi:NAD(P)/FAD-dependent oxidoreductase [Williamsia serinedens]|uniref:Sulfide:quinone oxidoreductase n=1 Tax=Williamsia serinedens TaxID=391736 RepID=A0ABT1H1F5_9NOCA|nr:FAD-dependent oxidoreductase [Williamsia serinedens]MCP2159637.1 sulfide:quinone oxidoreductase [Williamsia serinedens]
MPEANSPEHVDVVVLGGGNAGVAVAAQLRRRGVHRIAIVEPSTTHTYRPLLSYVGGGEASLPTAQRSQASVTPRGCRWVRSSVETVTPAEDPDGDHMVACADGTRLACRDLVVATGLVPDDDALPGIAEALTHPTVVSNYLDAATRTWAGIRGLGERGGHAVFTLPRPPVSCSATTLKPLFMALDHWDGAGSGVWATVLVDRPTLIGVDELDRTILDALRDRGVRVRTNSTVVGVDADARRLRVRTADGVEDAVDYDLLHLVPPYRAGGYIERAGLAGGHAGLVDVDPETFAHKRFPRVWSLGDCADLGTDPSGGALRKQAPVCAHNIVASRRGTDLRRYDGYTVAPVTVSRHRAVLGEFDRTRRMTSSLPSFLSPLKPRLLTWAFDRYALPQIYWRLILRALA